MADAFPTHRHPRPEVRDVPEEPRRYLRLIGPGIIAAGVVTTSYARNADESKVYSGLVWAVIAIGIVVLLAGLDQPLVLLVISAVVGGFVVFVDAGLLILVDRRILPAPIRVRGVRLAALVWAILLFGTLSVLTSRVQLQTLFGG